MAAATGARLVETHTAFVLMVGDRALKWKKPVVYDFVDFGTLERRRRACEDELRLNRRLAPDVYLGLDTLVDEAGAAVEHAVVMRRLPDAARLSTLVEQGRDVRSDVRRLARLLAAFHSRCAPSPDPEAVAGSARLDELWQIGLDALDAHGTGVLDPTDVAEARWLVSSYLHGREPLLGERVARGHVRDGHGDLLADDVFCLPEGPQVLDCLDFDASLRHGDVLGDLAMLAMDLERLGDPGSARQLLRDYAEFSGERHPTSLEHLYVAYRAQVRAKVALLRAEQTTDEAVREEQRRQAVLLVRLLLAHLREGRPRLVLVGGPPGSGKTTLAEALAEREGWLVHSSDLVRRELALPADRRYTTAAVDAVYAELRRRAEQELAQGWDVVLDATWTDERQRQLARDVAARTSSAVVELCCAVPAGTVERRLAARPAGHPSDADAAVAAVLAQRAAPWSTAHVVDTSVPVGVAVRAAQAAIRTTPEPRRRPA